MFRTAHRTRNDVCSNEQTAFARVTTMLERENEVDMLTTIAVVLLVLWLAGVVTSTSMGGLIHVLLVIAVVMVLVRVIQGRRVFD